VPPARKYSASAAGGTELVLVFAEKEGIGAPPQYVRLAGFRRFQRALDEIKACIGSHSTDADSLAREIVELQEKPKSEDPEEAEEDEAAVEAKREKLVKVKKDIEILETFYTDTKIHWSDITHRNIGHIDWAPKIPVDVQRSNYTLDIGTFEVDAVKFKAFKGNVVDFGAFDSYLISTSSNKKNFIQDRSSLPSSSPISFTPTVVAGQHLSGRQTANLRLMVALHVSFWLSQTASTRTVGPASLS